MILRSFFPHPRENASGVFPDTAEPRPYRDNERAALFIPHPRENVSGVFRDTAEPRPYRDNERAVSIIAYLSGEKKGEKDRNTGIQALPNWRSWISRQRKNKQLHTRKQPRTCHRPRLFL